jgi:hypothetical protein
MELKVRGWSRHKKRPPQTLKKVSLSDEAQIGGTIYHSDTRITAVPRGSVKIDFGVNLTKFGGDYLASLSFTSSDVRMLYRLCFGDLTQAG